MKMNKKMILSILAGSVLLSGLTNGVSADLNSAAVSDGIVEQMQGGRGMQRGGNRFVVGQILHILRGDDAAGRRYVRRAEHLVRTA